ncbi:hypothetical protein H0H92_002243 [Tricholoma furcatifolium]|nr:hypothetical protein H0H92_002243 [Tricholoma furcatifolium]
MRSLEWDAPLTLCVIFMHKNLKSLALFLNPDASRVFEDNTTSVARVFEDIVSRMPKVSELDLRFQFPVREIEEGLVKLCSSLLDLRSITLPRFCLTTKLAESLSQLSNLQTIDFQYFDYQGYGDSLDISNFEPVLSEGCFTSLWELSLTISFDDAVKFLTIPFFPSNLTILFIDSPSIEDPTAVQALTSAVPDVCPLLKELTLISFVEPHMPFNSPPKKEECINIDAFRPLFKCPNLTSFELEHHYPLHLDLADVEEIATSWPAIEVLSLNTQPVYAEHTNLTLRALLPFARHCPKLQRLGMFLHATITDFPTADQASVYQLPPFRALHTLSMGVSPIEEEGSVALFLSQICPLDCVIEKGVTWNDRDLAPDDILDTVYERFGKWKKVEELLPLLTKLRIEERERAQLLKKEVQDLRIRTEILMDKFALSGAPVDGCITL